MASLQIHTSWAGPIILKNLNYAPLPHHGLYTLMICAKMLFLICPDLTVISFTGSLKFYSYKYGCQLWLQKDLGVIHSEGVEFSRNMMVQSLSAEIAISSWRTDLCSLDVNWVSGKTPCHTLRLEEKEGGRCSPAVGWRSIVGDISHFYYWE